MIITVLVECAGSNITVIEGDVVISITLNIIELGWTAAIEYKQRTM